MVREVDIYPCCVYHAPVREFPQKGKKMPRAARMTRTGMARQYFMQLEIYFLKRLLSSALVI